MSTYFAKVEWAAEDVMELAPKLSREEAEEWLARNERRLKDRLIELGYQVMDSLLAYDLDDDQRMV